MTCSNPPLTREMEGTYSIQRLSQPHHNSGNFLMIQEDESFAPCLHKPILSHDCLEQRPQSRNKVICCVAFPFRDRKYRTIEDLYLCTLTRWDQLYSIYQCFQAFVFRLYWNISFIWSTVWFNTTAWNKIKAHCLKVTASIFSQENDLSSEKTFSQYLTTPWPGWCSTIKFSSNQLMTFLYFHFDFDSEPL